MLQKETNIDSMIKAGNAFQFISPFAKSKAYEVTDEQSGEVRKYIETIASSDQEDLVGDVMSKNALEEMNATAVGTIMHRDHINSVEKIFGSVVESELRNENGKTLLWIKAEIEDSDTQNIKIWNAIKRGVKLGASVTVLCTSKANPNRKGSLIIVSAKLLEISIVTIPCNQDSWTLSAKAAAAIVNASRLSSSGSDATKTNSLKSEKKTMPNPATAVALPRATAAMKKHFERQAAHTATKTLPEVMEVATKGLFADEQAKRKPTLWDLWDILCSVKWNLMDRKWAMSWVDGVADDFDYVGEFKIACEEFAVAATASFAYWGGFEVDMIDSEVEDGMEGEVTEDVIENALELENAFTKFAEGFTTDSASPALSEQMKGIASNMLEVAAKIGVPFPGITATLEVAETSTEQIEKSVSFLEMKKRFEESEQKNLELAKELTETKEHLEIAKAGFETALEVQEQLMKQPLQNVTKVAATS